MQKEGKLQKIRYKIEDHMLLGSVYDTVMMKTKYKGEKLSFLYNVMIGQKHRMLFYKQLKKRYLRKCTANPYWEKEEQHANLDRIWFCWLQGMEHAPELVKRCYESLKKNLPDKEIIVITKQNMSEYVTMPEDIVRKWEEGIIGMAFFTDMLRLELLIKYGGYWIDSTVLCTNGELLKEIENVPLFMYSFYYFGFNPEIMSLNNWFIYSTTNNHILCLLREFLYTYWRERNRAVNYFFCHLFLTIALEYYESDYKKMPVVSQVDSHVLATYIFDDFDETKYRILKASTGFHKLSARFDPEEMKKQNTFYDVVIRQGKY